MKIQPQSFALLNKLITQSDFHTWSAEKMQHQVERAEMVFGSREGTATMTWITIPHEGQNISLGYGNLHPLPDPVTELIASQLRNIGSKPKPRDEYDVYALFVDGKLVEDNDVKHLVHKLLKEVEKVVKIAQNYLINLGRDPKRVCEHDWEHSFSHDERTQSFTSTKDGFVISCLKVDKVILDQPVQVYEASIASEKNLFDPVVMSGAVAARVFDAVAKYHGGEDTPVRRQLYDPERSWSEFAWSLLRSKFV